MKMEMTFDEFQEYWGKNVLCIYYEWWAGQFGDRFWTAMLNHSVIDYHTKDELIRQAKKRGQDYIVFKIHRRGIKKGKVSIAETNIN